MVTYSKAYLTKCGKMTSSYDVARKYGIKATRTFKFDVKSGKWILLKSKSKGTWC